MMLIQTQQQLKDLNEAYFEGELNYSDYRRKRGLMLDSLIDDITIPKSFATDTLRVKRPAALNQQTNKNSNKLIILIIAVLIICIGLAINFLLTSESPKSKPRPMANTETRTKLQKLVEDSLNNNKWTIAQLNQIESQWNTLSPAERKNARQRDWHPKLTDALNSLASEQKALVDLGKKDAVVFEQQIMRLSVLLKND